MNYASFFGSTVRGHKLGYERELLNFYLNMSEEKCIRYFLDSLFSVLLNSNKLLYKAKVKR